MAMSPRPRAAGDDRRAPGGQRVGSCPPLRSQPESEHLRSLAQHCQRAAGELADVEMARLFSTIAAEYDRRAARLAVIGR